MNKLKYLIKRVILTLIIIVIFISALFLIKPNIFIENLESYIVNKISSESDIILDIGHLEGNFINGFIINNIKLSNDIQFINAKKLFIKPDLFSLLYKNIRIKNVVLNSAEIYYNKENDVQGQFKPPNIHIENFKIIGLDLFINDKEFNINGQMQVFNNDKIMFFDNIDLKILSNVIKTDTLYAKEGLMKYSNSKFEVENLKLEKMNLKSSMDAIISFNDSLLMNVNVKVNRYEQKPNEYISDLLIYNTNFVIDGNIDNLIYNINGGYKLNNDVKGKIKSTGYLHKNILFTDTELWDDEEIILHINNDFNISNGNWKLISNLKNFKIPLIDNKYIISGKIQSYGHLFKTIQSSLNIAIVDQNNKYSINDIVGKIYIDNGKLSSIGDISFIEENISGKINNLFLSNDSMGFDARIYFDNFKINEYLKISNIPSIINGQSNITFYANNNLKKMNGNLITKEFSTPNYYIGKSQLDFNLFSKNDDKYFGDITALFNDITTDYKTLNELFFTLSFNDNNFLLDSLNTFNDTGDFIILNNLKYNSDSLVFCEKFEASIFNTKISFNNIFSKINNQVYQFQNIPIIFGEGNITLSGKITSQGRYDIWSTLENVELYNINQLFNFNQRLTGTATGRINISNLSTYHNLLSNFKIIDGNVDDIIFKQCSGNISFRKNRLLLNEFKINTGIGNIEAEGWLTSNGINNDFFKHNDSLNIKIDFNSFDFQTLNRYLPWTSEVGGIFSGNTLIKGMADNLNIKLDTKVESPFFDKIEGELISGKILYKKSNLYLSGINLTTKTGKYTVTGNIPIDISLIKKSDIDINKLPMDIMMTGNFKKFELLTPYLTKVDTLTGNFSLQLSINGTYENPNRNGQLIIQNGKLNLLSLSNSIDNINAVALLKNNKLIIDKFTGTSIPNIYDNTVFEKIENYITKIIGNEKDEEIKNNISIKGSIDMNDFFKPDYSLLVNGYNLFLKDNDSFFEGYGDLEIAITGKDSVNIMGVYKPEANNFTIISEFKNNEKIQIKKMKSYPYYSYDIQLPLEDGIKISNSQMDLFLDGYLNISSRGNEDFRYSGKLNLIDGSFYYNGNEFSNLEGSIMLDPTSFNPSIDIYATTNIAGEDIDVSMNGHFNNPILILESINDYSQSDIIELLLFRDNVQDSDNATTNPQLESFISNYLENELERNISKYTFLNKFQLNTSGSLISGFENKNIELYVGANISPKIYMNFKRGLFSSDNNFEYEVGYRLNKNTALIARIDEEKLFHLNYRLRYHY